jgi:hypothetical protein
VQTLEEQAARAYAQFLAQPTPLAQNTFMEALRDRNETLYDKLLVDQMSTCVMWSAGSGCDARIACSPGPREPA